MGTVSDTIPLQSSRAMALHTRSQAKRPVEPVEFSRHDPLEALRRRNRDLSAYAHTVAHNLKDPLSVILGISDAIFRISDLTPEELHVYLRQIQSTAHLMDDMIDNILLLGELDQAAVPVGTLDMERIVSHIRMRLAYMISQYGAQINAPAAWPEAVGYEPWIEDVWANLMSNAIKYGGRPPRLDLGSAILENGMIQFWVQDNGQGIPQESQAQLFRPFTQLGPVRTPGHGLGLSIVRGMIEKLGGRVGVQTEGGTGSRFFFTLPPSR